MLSEAGRSRSRRISVALGEMQEGRAATLAIRLMPSIAPSVFALEGADSASGTAISTWLG